MYNYIMEVFNNVNDGRLKVLVSTSIKLRNEEKEALSQMRENDARRIITEKYHGNMARV